MFGDSIVALFVLLGLMWVFQFYLTYRQMKRFYGACACFARREWQR